MRIHNVPVLLLLAFLLATPVAYAEEQWYDNGFAQLHQHIDDVMGSAITAEYSTDDAGCTSQLATNGLAYWCPGKPSVFTDGYNRWAYEGSIETLVHWQGDVLWPPAAEPKPLTAPAYIALYSRYPARAVCVSRIETGSWTAFWNPVPVGREHAYGYFGWLDSTARSVSTVPMDLASEVAGFDRMLDHGRGNEFYGIRAGLC